MYSELVSIIIPYYNSIKYIGKTIDSIKDQQYEYFECILIDDGSNDDSYDLVNSYIINDNRFKNYMRSDSFVKGGRGSKNYGFSLSTGQYIVFFDSDDIMFSDFIQSRIDFLKQNRSLDAVISDFGWKVKSNEIRRVYKYNPVLFENFKSSITEIWFWLNYCDYNFFFQPGNFMWKRNVLDGNEMWNELTTIGEDYEFHCRQFLKGINLGYIQIANWDYMYNNASMISTSDAVIPLLGRSYSRMLVLNHINNKFANSKIFVKNELNWQIKILRRIISVADNKNERKEAKIILYKRISEIINNQRIIFLPKKLYLFILYFIVFIHERTNRFYRLYNIICFDNLNLNKKLYYTIQ